MSDDGALWTTTIPNATLLAADDSGRYVVTGTSAGHLTLLDAATGRVVAESRIETGNEKSDDDGELAPGRRRLTRIEVATDGTIAAALTTMVTHAGDLHVELFVKPLAANAQDLGIEPDAAIDHWDGPWALDPGGRMLGYGWTAEDEMIPRLHLRTLGAADEVTIECGLDDEIECDAAAIDAARDMFAVAGETEVFLWHRGAVRAWKKPHAEIDLVVLSDSPDALWAVTITSATVWLFDAMPVRGARLPASSEIAAFSGIDRGAHSVRWLTRSGSLVSQRFTDGWVRESSVATPELGNEDVAIACGARSLLTLREGVAECWPLPTTWSEWRSPE